MKTRLLVISALAAMTLSSAAFAVDLSNNATSASNSGAGAAAKAEAFSNGVTTTNNGPDLSRAVGIATAPALTTTLTETCMGSTSFGAGFSGGSFSFGTTWRDTACVRRLDARQIQSMGDTQAAKEIMCDSDLVRAAFKRVGRPCAEDGGSYAPVSRPAPVPEPVAAEEQKATSAPVRDDQDELEQKMNRIEKERSELFQKYGYER